MADIPVYRCGKEVKNLFSSQGELKEPQLTAYLAYLLGQNIKLLSKKFIHPSELVERINIEESASGNRFDISIYTDKRRIVVEAKLSKTQRSSQIIQYVKHLMQDDTTPICLILLDLGEYSHIRIKNELSNALPRRVKIVPLTWDDIYQALEKASKSTKKDSFIQPLANELMKYLEENNMTKEQRKEVYVRDLDAESTELFFKYRLYISQPKFEKSASGCKYFAPAFINDSLPYFESLGIPMNTGISYISPILDMQILERNEVKDYLISQNHPNAKEGAKKLLKYAKRRRNLICFRLGQPYRIFLSPIPKRKLRIFGATGSKHFTFKELFEAAVSE